VYGVAATAPRRETLGNGVGGSAVEVIEHGGLAALTSPLTQDSLTAKDVRAHWRVLERAFAEGTVLPVRFGTVMESEEAVRERMLDANAERLSGLLSELDGRVQLNVKGRYDEQVLLREIVTESPRIAAMREQLKDLPTGAAPAQQLELGRLVEAEIERRRLQDAAIAHERLAPLAVAVREEQAGHPIAFNFACLVQSEREPQLTAAVSELGAGFGQRIGIRYVGPMAPFSFADAELGSRDEAWA
jgi:hypothetical protein